MADSADTTKIMHQLGLLTGSLEAMHQNITAQVAEIKSDIRRMDSESKAQLNRLEDGLLKQIADNREAVDRRIDGVDVRISDLEKEDKGLIREIAKYSAIGGSASGALIAGAIELMKRV